MTTSDASVRNGGSDGAERRFLTIVFVDLVGYSQLSEQLDPEELVLLQRRYQDLAHGVMQRFGGFVARFVGDGILVYFGYPKAHERDAERALRASLELLRELTGLDTDVQGRSLPPLQARIGAHSGLAVLAHDPLSAGTNAPGVVGDVAVLAARLQSLAPPGGVLVSRETLELVEGLFEFEALGQQAIKGFSHPVPVFRVVRPLQDTAGTFVRLQRGATRMVGRDAALAQTLARWAAAVGASRCQTVAIVAEAGVGKTRLVHELCRRPELSDATVLQAACQEIFARTPLHPLASLLWSQAGLTVEDDGDARERKLATLLAELGLDTDEHRRVLASLLGLARDPVTAPIAPTPQLEKRKQYALAIAMIERIAQRNPAVLWIEDCHWLDPSSAELLREAVGALRGAPLLILLTTRTFPAGPSLPEPDEIVRLEQLDRDDALAVARSVPGAGLLADEDLAQAVRAAEGVPLFVEQLVISLMDERAHAPGRIRRLGGVPLKLAEMMSERLDRLPGGRRIVQAASCIGRSFDAEFLRSVLGEPDADFERPLDVLVDAEILRLKRIGAEVHYDFRHTLLQRMAYESIVQAERRALHGRIVAALRAGSALRWALPEVVAHHLTEAGRFEDAIAAWHNAGVVAARGSAHVEAIHHLRKGLALLDRIDEPARRRQLELDLQVALMGSIVATQSATSMELAACCDRGLALAREGAPSPLVFPFAFGQFTFVNCRGRTDEAEQLARGFVALAGQHGNESVRVIGHRMLGMALLAKGEAGAARAELEQSLALYVPERDAATTFTFGQNTQIHSKALLSLTRFCLGDVDAALELGLDALHQADALKHPHSTAIPLVYVGGWVFGLCDAVDDLMRESRRLIALAEQHGLGGFRLQGAAFLGWALCQRGELAQGIATIEQAVAAFEGVEFHLALAGHLANLADARRRVGKPDEAANAAARALELAPRGSRWLEPELQRVHALVKADLAPRHRGEAESELRSAVASAARLGFPVLERRSLVSLRNLLAPSVDAVVEARLGELAHLDRLEQRVKQAVRTRWPDPHRHAVAGAS